MRYGMQNEMVVVTLLVFYLFLCALFGVEAQQTIKDWSCRSDEVFMG